MANKFVVVHVCIESLNDPVSIQPRLSVGGVPRGRLIRITRQIQPVPPPSFAVVRRRQQPLDELRVGIRRTVLLKLLDFFWGRWQADEIKRDASQQRAAVGGEGWFELLLFQRCEHKCIHGPLHPLPGDDGRRRNCAHGLKRPKRASGCIIDFLFDCRSRCVVR